MFLSTTQTDRSDGLDKHTVLRHVYPVAVLVIIALAAYWYFYAPILYSDDWSHAIGRWYYGKMAWFDLGELRPFQKIPFVILYGIFGLNVHAFYVANLIFNILIAILLYFLLLRLIPQNKLIAFSIAAIALIYPVDFARMWVAIIHIRIAGAFMLLYAYLLLVYSDTEHRGALWGALLCLASSFIMYDGPLGIAITWCLLLVLMKRTSSWSSRLNLLLPLVVCLLFILWRTAGYSILGIRDNYQYIDRLQLNPVTTIQRLIWGFQVMVWAWLDPLIYAFGLNVWQAMAILLVTIAFCGILVDVVIGQMCPKRQDRNSMQPDYLDQLRCFLLLTLISPIFIVAGYIPFVTVFQPTLIQAGTRLNAYALLGASVTLVSLLTVVVLLLRRKQQGINFVVLAAVFPLIILGIMVQARVQYDDRVAWEEQKQIWRGLFELAPDLKDGTSVHFIFSDNEDQAPSLNRNGQRLPLFGNWDATAALNVLYGKYDLHGDVTTKDLFSTEGIKNKYGNPTIPYDRALVVAYDGNPKRLRIVEDLQAENLVDFSVVGYVPNEHIIEIPTTRSGLRWLVGVIPDRPEGPY